MSEEFNNKTRLAERLKNLKINRPAVVSASLLVAAVVVISAIAVASNRSKKDIASKPDTVKPDTEQTEQITPPADTEVKDTDGYRCAIFMRDDPKTGGYTRLNTDEWMGMKFATFRSGMAKGVYLIQRY